MVGVWLIALLIPSWVSLAYSFDVLTHAELTRWAVVKSNLDGFLKSQLNRPEGIHEGLATPPEKRSVVEWIAEGSVREDDDFRFFNHFHNPFRDWDRAGLRVFGFRWGSSSAIWTWRQDRARVFTWQAARRSYFEALTAATQVERERHFAETFLILGHLVHLVQDAAVPAHTRNDPHPPWNRDGFEYFVENLRISEEGGFDSMSKNSVRFESSILTLNPNPSAPVPVARILDTYPAHVGQGALAETKVGLSEYSHKNFLSEDTIFIDAFPYPRQDDLGPPVPVNNRRYFPNIPGENSEFFLVTERTFTERLLSFSWFGKNYALDPGVYEAYAKKLLPRAVGYSAGLIDYFFRGSIDVIAWGSTQQPNAPITQVRVCLKTDEDAGKGKIVGILQFLSSGHEFFAVSQPKDLDLTREPQEVVFEFSQDPIPPGASNLFLMVVYKGRLGSEEEAVMAEGRRISDLPSVSSGVPFAGCP